MLSCSTTSRVLPDGHSYISSADLLSLGLQPSPCKFEVALKTNLFVGRLGVARDVASAIVFLASDEAAYITGHVLDVNGGMYLA